MHLLIWLVILTTPPAGPPQTVPPAAEVHQLQFHSDFLMNLHHTLYGAAWARRPEAGTLKALAGKLPAPLDAAMTPAERAAWDAAVDYYDRNVASRDLLFGRGMYAIKTALVAGGLSSGSIGPELRRALESAAPVYRKYFWPAHDRANREWIEQTATRVRDVGHDVIGRLTKLYDMPWFSSPVRIDVVWVANRQGAYATEGPAHATIASGDPDMLGWAAVETVFHEISHTLIEPIEKRLAAALGDRAREHGVLWHVVQFYVTGQVVRDVLAARGIEYTPYMNETGLFDRAWGKYRPVVEGNWRPYVEGKVTMDDAVAGTVKGLK